MTELEREIKRVELEDKILSLGHTNIAWFAGESYEQWVKRRAAINLSIQNAVRDLKELG